MFVLEVAHLVVGPKHCSQSEFRGQDVAVLDMWGSLSANREFRGQDPSIFRSVLSLTLIYRVYKLRSLSYCTNYPAYQVLIQDSMACPSS
jgi:hypothetical protein